MKALIVASLAVGLLATGGGVSAAQPTTTPTPSPSTTTTTVAPPSEKLSERVVPSSTTKTDAPASATAPSSTAQAPAPSSSSVTTPAVLPGVREPFVKWTPTENPNSTIIPGKMRSDRQEVPAPYTKEEADQAEIQEAKILEASRSRNARSSGATTAFAAAAPTDCMNYWPTPQYFVCGAIRVKYDSLGGPTSFLGWPTSNELTNPDGFGRRNTFLLTELRHAS
ncbi:hypothetical protein ACFVKB_47150 [Rhodococcus sp. NPDC127530]|uniref:hypothetical protein n=1 Tax=unclassified Rhodococcus (in: high G+C Gram-positive bacteria) TaxID=192944 RepID=UPI00363C74DD